MQHNEAIAIPNDNDTGLGGGIAINNCGEQERLVTIGQQNEIEDNFATRKGGGVYAEQCLEFTFTGNRVVDNWTCGDWEAWQQGGDCADGGAGLYLWYSNVAVTSNYIEGNWDDDGGCGGGICCINSEVNIRNNRIDWNCVGNRGGGIYYFNCVGSIVNNLIVKNEKWWHPQDGGGGGGIYIGGRAAPYITNNTITGNDVGNWGGATGGGIYYDTYEDFTATTEVWNTILWGNGQSLPSGQEVYVSGSAGGTLEISYCDVCGGWSGQSQGGNITPQDPEFCDGDYRIMGFPNPCSPCIDVGRDDAPGRPAIDFESQTRPADGDHQSGARTDIGWDEVPE